MFRPPELIKKLVAIDAHWIPQVPGYSLYIRPTLSELLTALPSRTFTDIVLVSWEYVGTRCRPAK